MRKTAHKKLTPARFTYTGIRVRDLKRSLQFYKKIMGMREVIRGRMNAGGVFVQLESQRARSSSRRQLLELNYYPPKAKYHERYDSGSELDHLAFWARDVDEEFKRIVSTGAKVAVKPFSEAGYRLAFVKDHDGIWLELIGVDRRKRKRQRSG